MSKLKKSKDAATTNASGGDAAALHTAAAPTASSGAAMANVPSSPLSSNPTDDADEREGSEVAKDTPGAGQQVRNDELMAHSATHSHLRPQKGNGLPLPRASRTARNTTSGRTLTRSTSLPEIDDLPSSVVSLIGKPGGKESVVKLQARTDRNLERLSDAVTHLSSQLLLADGRNNANMVMITNKVSKEIEGMKLLTGRAVALLRNSPLFSDAELAATAPHPPQTSLSVVHGADVRSSAVHRRSESDEALIPAPPAKRVQHSNRTWINPDHAAAMAAQRSSPSVVPDPAERRPDVAPSRTPPPTDAWQVDDWDRHHAAVDARARSQQTAGPPTLQAAASIPTAAPQALVTTQPNAHNVPVHMQTSRGQEQWGDSFAAHGAPMITTPVYNQSPLAPGMSEYVDTTALSHAPSHQGQAQSVYSHDPHTQTAHTPAMQQTQPGYAEQSQGSTAAIAYNMQAYSQPTIAPNYMLAPQAPQSQPIFGVPTVSHAPPAPRAAHVPPAPLVAHAPPAPLTAHAPPAPLTAHAPPAPLVAHAPPAPTVMVAPLVPHAPPAPLVAHAPPAPSIPVAPSVPKAPSAPVQNRSKPRNNGGASSSSQRPPLEDLSQAVFLGPMIWSDALAPGIHFSAACAAAYLKVPKHNVSICAQNAYYLQITFKTAPGQPAHGGLFLCQWNALQVKGYPGVGCLNHSQMSF